MNIFVFELTAWRIFFILFLIFTVGLNFFLASKIEGFQTGQKDQIDTMVVCPAIRANIENHETLLEGYTARDASMSIKQTKRAIELLNDSYSNYGCKTVQKAKAEEAE